MPPKINKLKLFDENPSLAVHHELVALNDNFDRLIGILESKEAPIQGEIPVKINGADVVTIKGEKGDRGEKGERGLTGLNGKDGKDGKNGFDGKDGRDGKNGKDGLNGINGRDGKDGSPDSAEDLRNKLELLQGDERLNKSSIKGLDDELQKISETARVRNATGVSDMRIIQAFKYILKTEAPVGAINGVNTTYTVSQPIFAVLAFSINGEVIAQLPNYTVSNRTITFSSPLPSAYSGKDFEVKYI